MALSRRGVLGATLAMGVPWPVAKAGSLDDRVRFLFIHASGGWDPTRVFAVPESDGIDIEDGLELVSDGDISWGSHARRPSVDSFFSRYGDRTAILNGLVVRSISHEICRMVLLTGGSNGEAPDWPVLLASEGGSALALPHLVLSGPSFNGDYGVLTARDGRNQQLESLIGTDVRFLDQEERATKLPTQEAQALVDAWVQERSLARELATSDPRRVERFQQLRGAQERAILLKELHGEMSFDTDGDLLAQGEVALDCLARGVSRCVTTMHPPTSGGFSWDSHADNDEEQSEHFEDLFDTLDALVGRMDGMTTETGTPLSEVTVIAVLSEMGRAPRLNGSQGKDHWPYTSAMLIGAGVRSGVVGGFDDDLVAEELDGRLIGPEELGATLFALAGEDHTPFLDADPVDDLLG